MLIDQLTTEFEPEKYTDEYRTALLELIESKRTGMETVTPNTREVAASNVTDLMAALQASIDRTKPAAADRTKTASIERPKPVSFDSTKPKKPTTRKKTVAKVKKEA
jgi:DNA end-binding protein Ku